MKHCMHHRQGSASSPWGGDVPQPAARSSDLSPCDFFLWGYLKFIVYNDKPRTLQHLDDIRQAIEIIPVVMLERVEKSA